MSNSSETCSVCLSSNAILIEVSATDKNKVKLSSKLRLCVPEVDWSGNCCICLNCIEQLEIVYTFCRLCLQSYEVRRQQALLVIKTEEAPLESKEICDFQVESRLNEDETLDSCFISIDEAKDLTSEDRVVQRQNRCIENCMDEKPDIDIENMPVDDIDEKYIDLNNVFVKTEESCDIDVANEAGEMVEQILPKKSKLLYEKEYNIFCDWRKNRNLRGVSEDIMLSYFDEKLKKYKVSTLWSYYSMLKTMLFIKEYVDISKYMKLKMLLKQEYSRYQPVKSNVLEREHIDAFLNDAPDSTFLMIKVALLMGIAGGCRMDELHKMKVDDVEDRGSVVVVGISDSKTNKKRMFTIVCDGIGIDKLEIYRKYAALRPANVPLKNFFLCYRDQKCTKQPVGINSFYKMPRIVANYLKLPSPERFTGHCFRRSSATLLANTGANILTMTTHGSWKTKLSGGRVYRRINAKQK